MTQLASVKVNYVNLIFGQESLRANVSATFADMLTISSILIFEYPDGEFHVQFPKVKNKHGYWQTIISSTGKVAWAKIYRTVLEAYTRKLDNSKDIHETKH